MPRRRMTQEERVARIGKQLEAIERISPTTVDLFEEWIDRLIAGEPLSSIKPEMDRLNELLDAARRRQKRRPTRRR